MQLYSDEHRAAQRRILGAFCIALGTACGGGDGSTEPRTVAAVTITTASATLRPGESQQFTGIAVDAGGREIGNAGTAAWQSSAPSVATVSATGLVQGVTPGSASISATIGTISGSRLVTVLPLGAGAVVTMPGNSFIPFQVSIRSGEQVFFEFPRSPHNVIFDKKAGVPQDIQQTANLTIPRRFDVAGQFPYDCTLHPGMTGLVIVANSSRGERVILSVQALELLTATPPSRAAWVRSPESSR